MREVTYDERLEDVEADVLRVRARDVRPEQGRECGRVDRGGLDERLDDVPLGRHSSAELAHPAI